MAKGKYQKKMKMTQPVNKSNGRDFTAPEVQEEIKQREFYYLDLQNREVLFINHLVQGYFDELQEHKHLQSVGLKFNRHTSHIPAWISPERLDKHIINMQTHMIINPYNIHKIYAAYLRKPQFPLSLNNTDDIPVAYIWFYLSMDIHGDNFMQIEQLFIMPEYDRYVSIIKNLPSIAFEYGKRFDIKRTQIEVSTIHMQKQWKMWGFKPTVMRMEFDGTVQEFEDRKLTKATKTIRNSEGEIWDQAHHKVRNH